MPGHLTPAGQRAALDGYKAGFAEMVAFVKAQLDADEMWARRASRGRDGEYVRDGVHWQWVNPHSDEPVTIDPGVMEYVDDNAPGASLRSVEHFPTGSVGDLPMFSIHRAEEIEAAAGGHIVWHDPAHVLAEVAAKRRAVDDLARIVGGDYIDDGEHRLAEHMLCVVAAMYADRPGYKEVWKP